MSMQRRSLLAAALALGPALPALAQFRVEISGVGATQLPIAIPGFRDDGEPSVAAIVRADLERSGYFRLVDGPGPLDEGASPAFADWRGRQVDALVGGSVTRLADGRLDLRYKLWDVVKGAPLIGQSLPVVKNDLRLGAHRISDAIYQQLTGEKGVFSTRIAYVSRERGRHVLWVADADGEGAQEALASPAAIISPAWSPDGGALAYVSFEAGKAEVFVQELSSGKRRSVARFKGSNSAPAWSPDGQRLALTLSRDGGSQLYVMGRNGDNVQRLTQSMAIDTEATWSADGKFIYFVSDRGGAPQIYRIASGGGNAERITFSGSYNISPALSPDGRYLAFVTRQGGGDFRLQLQDLNSGNVTALTDTRDDESPSFAPNGKLLIYATRTRAGSVLMTTTLDGKIKARLASSGDIREPAWGPFGR